MSARSSSARRRLAAAQRLRLEALEPRQVLTHSLVAIGSDIGPGSRPLIQLVEAETGEVVAETLAFEEAFRGGTRVAMGNVDGLPGSEVLVASGPGRVGEIRVFAIAGAGESRTLSELPAFRFRPFGDRYVGGLTVSAGEVNGDGWEDIAVAKSRGGDVSVFLSPSFGGAISAAPFRTFTPFGASSLGGASVAFADVGTFVGGRLVDAARSDGRAELVVASGTGMAPSVAVYDLSGARAEKVDSFRPFSAAVRGGLAVTAGRYDTDSIDDVVVTSASGGPGTEIYDGRVAAADNARLASFAAFAGTSRPRASAFAAAVDRNGDGRIDGFAEAQGLSGGGGSAGLAFLGQSGGRTNLFPNVNGPLRVAAPRTSFNDFSTTLSGIRYRVIEQGRGAVPQAGDKVTTHYTGWLLDGTKFDSSRDKGTPFSFTLAAGEVIKGWDEMVSHMRVGGRRTVIIPASLAYGSDAKPGIPPNSTLVFDMELLSIS